MESARAKAFEQVGQLTQLYQIGDGSEVKRRVAECADEAVIEIRWDEQDPPIQPKTVFYDWVYPRALSELLEEKKPRKLANACTI